MILKSLVARKPVTRVSNKVRLNPSCVATSRVQQRQVLVVNFCSFEIKFCFVVAMSDIVHDVETMHGLCNVNC